MSTWLVTGANRGIGLELVRQLAAAGERVIATSRQPDSAAELGRLAARVVALDVALPASIDLLPKHIDEPIDVLINNAGVSSTSNALSACTPDEFARVFAINSTGPILVARALIDRLRAGRRKAIVHITSQLGSIANNTGGSSYAYRASKAALNQLNRSLAAELTKEAFTCVAIHPGWVRTDMGGPQAPLTPPQSAEHILRTIAALSPADSGKFLNYDGVPLPW